MSSHRRVLWAAVLILTAAVVAGADLPAHLSHGGFTSPHFESDRALELIGKHFVPGGNSTLAIVRSDDLTVDDPRFAAALTDALSDLPDPPLVSSVHYWNTGRRELLSTDRHAASVVVGLAGESENERVASYEQLRQAFHPPGFEVGFTGLAPLLSDFDHAVDHDLTRAELVAAPLLFLLLVLFFGSLVAALVPLVVAALTLTVSFAALRALTLLLPVGYVTRNVVVMVALGLTVDYSIFVVARFRRELARNGEVSAAVARTVATAGRTVLFSAAVISLASLGLALLPLPVTRALGLGTAVSVALCGITSRTVLPAVLALLGHRIDAGRLRAPRSAGVRESGDGFWYRLGRATVRHPAPWLVTAVLAIAVLSVPAARFHPGSSDQRVLPAASASRQAADALPAGFPDAALDQLQVFIRLRTDLRAEEGGKALEDWRGRVGRLPGAQSVRLWAGTPHTAYLTVKFAGTPDSPAAGRLVRQIRSLGPPDGGQLLVGGLAARNTDVLDALGGRLPLLIGYLLATVCALLCIAFRSVVVPVKAVLTTTMSLGVSFAAVTWVVQEGHGSRFLGFAPTGYVGAIEAVSTLILVFALSVDYEVFLIARIRERYDQGAANSAAIVEGLGRTGGLITAAAALVMVVAAAFTTSPVITVKEIALGVLVAVGVDATLVRMILVPAALQLIGERNWWTPAFPSRRPSTRSSPRCG
ncbi:MMPL family transporter [Kitasatospora sp. NPDC098663]|uniref:MMPL family transporter n=1 Tax=Kitasatospora sp. NPDC098663 TaxID=3364096 RepID=UPI00381013A9